MRSPAGPLRLLKASLRGRDDMLIFDGVDPALDGLRAESQFADLLRGVGVGR